MISKLKGILFGRLPNPVNANVFYNGAGQFSAPAFSAGWTLISSVTASGANQDFINLSGYNEILIIIRAVTTSLSAIREVLVSTDNGSSFLTASGDYILIDTSGVEANDVSLSLHNGGSASARSGWMVISLFNQATYPKVVTVPSMISGNLAHIIPTTSALNAIRVRPTAGTFSGGTISVFGR